MNVPSELSRDDLYRLVWEVPMRTLAAKYGLSDVGLSKICRRIQVPVPGRGYWARKAAGARVRRTPLRAPRDDAGQNKSTAIFDHRRIERQEALSNGELAPYRAHEKAPANRIVVGSSLRAPHPVILATLHALRTATPVDGLLSASGRKTLRAAVSPRCLPRAMRIADAIAKALNKRGWELIVSTDEAKCAFARVLGEEVPFEVRERLRKLPPAPAKAIRLGPGQYYTPRAASTFELTGKLAVSIVGYWGDGLRQTWADGKRQRVEEMLNDFMLHLAMAANAQRQRRQRIAQQQLQWEQARLARLDAERLQAMEESRIAKFRAHAEKWARSEQLTGFLAALRHRLADQPDAGTADSVRDDWLAWAGEYARTINPLERPLVELWTETPN